MDLHFRKKRQKIFSIGIISFPFLLFFIFGCQKEDEQYLDNEQTIIIAKNIIVDNGVKIHDPDLNLIAYEKFLRYLASSDRFLIVTQKDFEKTNANDKVVISIRHDIDRNMDGAIRMAYREHKYGIKATYFVLHTAKYYGMTKNNSFSRDDRVIYFLKKIQDAFSHEIGFHNDLVTLQVVYGIEPKSFLKEELKWLRDNGISIYGTAGHGSEYCYKYHYLNTYFWKESPNYGGNFSNHDFIPKYQGITHSESSNFSDTKYNPNVYGIQIVKDYKENYSLTYDSDYLITNYNFSDCTMFSGGKRWHMGMEDFGKIPLGNKVIILLHAEHWD